MAIILFLVFAYLFLAISGIVMAISFEKTPKQARIEIKNSILWPMILTRMIVNRIRWVFSDSAEEEGGGDF